MEQYPVSEDEIKAVLALTSRSLDKEPYYQVKVLFDNNVPRGLARSLTAHRIVEAKGTRLGPTEEWPAHGTGRVGRILRAHLGR
jgi:hypothetical protein